MHYDENDIIRMLKPDQVEEGRAVFFRYLANDAWRIFQDDARLTSVTFFVAQYWNDNASDEIHIESVASVRARPVVGYHEKYGEIDPYNIGWRRGQPESTAGSWYWAAAAPMLASYCTEGATQDDAFEDAYTPLIRFSRQADGSRHLESELLGTVHRPWLDGVAPAYLARNGGNVTGGLVDHRKMLDRLRATCDDTLVVADVTATVERSDDAAEPQERAGDLLMSYLERLREPTWPELEQVVDEIVVQNSPLLWNDLSAVCEYFPTIAEGRPGGWLPGHLGAEGLVGIEGVRPWFEAAATILVAASPDRSLASHVRSLVLADSRSWIMRSYRKLWVRDILDAIDSTAFPNLQELWLELASHDDTLDLRKFESLRHVAITPRDLWELEKVGRVVLPDSVESVILHGSVDPEQFERDGRIIHHVS